MQERDRNRVEKHLFKQLKLLFTFYEMAMVKKKKKKK